MCPHLQGPVASADDGRRSGGRYTSPFARWSAAVSDHFVPLEVGRTSENPCSFSGHLRSKQLSLLRLSEAVSRDVAVHRTSRTILQNDPGMVKLSLQVGGHGCVMQNDNLAELSPGDFAIYDTSRPYDLQLAGDCTVFVVMFPRQALTLGRRDLHAVSGHRIIGDAGFGRLLGPLFEQLRLTLAGQAPIGPALERAFLDLLGAVLFEEVASCGELRTSIVVREAQAYIENHLADPNLSTRKIAVRQNLSPRTLQKEFEREGLTVAGWIRTRRLRRFRADLTDPRYAADTIGAIAARHGMHNLSHLSRLFKDEFGVPPTRYRESGIAS